MMFRLCCHRPEAFRRAATPAIVEAISYLVGNDPGSTAGVTLTLPDVIGYAAGCLSARKLWLCRLEVSATGSAGLGCVGLLVFFNHGILGENSQTEEILRDILEKNHSLPPQRKTHMRSRYLDIS